ncbi:hypothetical protein D9615_007763 [Tricholomella constricta]|uniref:PIH1 N-terminal domain-containing protein n=1 Tax=Tricholomella constricta TaxID=117010 RepID=A0A8H5H322_9AGAR|nr:hypothetical protein D9615_007763 [Tricholomella constricta]
MSKTPIALKPTAGFCIKTATLHPAAFPLEPTLIPVGFKVFVNIAWDHNVPPPPDGSEDAIQRAMQGQDVDQRNPDGWYVPVVVSDGRRDKDKAGKPSLVFDCIYNTSVKARTLTDPEFKLFIVELALQRIEAQTSLALSRQIGTPNIASKGKLSPRTVYVPSFMVTGSPASQVTAPPTKPLIQEVIPPTSPSVKPKGILKAAKPLPTTPPALNANKTQQSRPTWTWAKENSKLQIRVTVPTLDRALIEQATLDIEPRRFIVHIPDCPVLDVNLALSDAEIVATAASRTSASLHEDPAAEPNNALTLKRQRDLDVQGATSEWRVAERILMISA